MRKPVREDFVEVLRLPVIKNDDPEITCIMCNLGRCDLAVELWGNGPHIWAGLHEKCLDRWKEICPTECLTYKERNYSFPLTNALKKEKE